MRTRKMIKRRRQRRQARVNKRRRRREEKGQLKIEEESRNLEKKERKKQKKESQQSLDSADKTFALAMKVPKSSSPGTSCPHMEWDGTAFRPTPPAPPPWIDVKINMMPAAHASFGVKWKGSRRGLYKPQSAKALADSGCQTSTAGLDFLHEINCPESFLIPTNHQIMGITKSSLNIVGAVLLRVAHEGRVTRQMVHISRVTRGLYLSESALKDLGLLPENFPHTPASASASETSQEEVSTCENCHGEKCIRRDTPPERPTSLPFPPTKENIPKFEKWFLETFASSAFNTCTRQPLPAMTGVPMKIKLKESAEENYSKAYRPIPVPYHYKAKVKADLDRDVRLGVIEKVPQGEIEKWSSLMVITAKANGDPRRTVDYQQLNKATLREVHHTPSPINLVASIPGNTLKTVLDAWNGYHILLLDEDSKYLTTFITEWGAYRYLRGPQGYHGTGDAFTRRFDDITVNEERYVRCIDDGLLYDDDVESAFWHTFNHLTLGAENGIIFNKEKFKFARDTVEFAGFDVTPSGYRPAQRIIQAIRNFPTPTSITDVKSWLGLVQHVAYTFSQSRIMRPFRSLTEKKRPFYWNLELSKLFTQSKEEIVRLIGDGVRAYDMNKPTCLATDWSKHGLGFSLMQKHCHCTGQPNPNCGLGHWQLVFAGSKTTNGAQSRYCPIEGECLAAAYGLERCRMYTLGCPDLTVAVDHNPLTRILNDRNLDDIVNPRLRRLKEKTLQYQFKICYVPGGSNAMKTADALSRHPTQNDGPDPQFDEVESIAHAYAASQADGVESVTWERVKEAASMDEECMALTQLIIDGFPTEKSLLPQDMQGYWGMREELYVIEGVPFKGKKMLIPTALRTQVLEGLHAANQGVTGMLSNARDRLFWPGLDAAVRQMRLQCRQCNKNSPSQPSEPLVVSPSPEIPFEQTVADFFDLEGHKFLAFADRFSGWLEVERLPTNSFRHAKRVFLRWFRTYGVPAEIATDGGPPFQSYDYKHFCQSWNIRKRLSSAYYPQSNGRAEAAVKSAKRILEGNIDPISGTLDTDSAARAIMAHRNTPCQETGIAPSVLLFGRPIRDHLPRYDRELRSEWSAIDDAREMALAKRALKDSPPTGKTLEPLNAGDAVQIQNQSGNHPTKWHNTGVIGECLPNRQYHVIVDGSRRVTLRNRKFLRKITPITRHAEDTDTMEHSPSQPVVPSNQPHTTTNLESGGPTGELDIPAHLLSPPRRSDVGVEGDPPVAVREQEHGPRRSLRVPKQLTPFQAKLSGKSHS
jgi:hypothetical protein